MANMEKSPSFVEYFVSTAEIFRVFVMCRLTGGSDKSRLDEAGFDTKVTYLKEMKTRDSAVLSPWFRSGCPDGRSSHTGLTSPGAVSRTWRGRRRAQHGRAGRRHDCREQLEAVADTPF